MNNNLPNRYIDISLYNDKATDIEAKITVNRQQSIIDDPSLYDVSLSRFFLPTSTLVSNNITDSNKTNWKVGISLQETTSATGQGYQVTPLKTFSEMPVYTVAQYIDNVNRTIARSFEEFYRKQAVDTVITTKRYAARQIKTGGIYATYAAPSVSINFTNPFDSGAAEPTQAFYIVLKLTNVSCRDLIFTNDQLLKDLEISLETPGGKKAIVCSHVGILNKNYDIYFSDSNEYHISKLGNQGLYWFQPQELFSKLHDGDTSSLLGNWKLNFKTRTQVNGTTGAALPIWYINGDYSLEICFKNKSPDYGGITNLPIYPMYFSTNGRDEIVLNYSEAHVASNMKFLCTYSMKNMFNGFDIYYDKFLQNYVIGYPQIAIVDSSNPSQTINLKQTGLANNLLYTSHNISSIEVVSDIGIIPELIGETNQSKSDTIVQFLVDEYANDFYVYSDETTTRRYRLTQSTPLTNFSISFYCRYRDGSRKICMLSPGERLNVKLGFFQA